MAGPFRLREPGASLWLVDPPPGRRNPRLVRRPVSRPVTGWGGGFSDVLRRVYEPPGELISPESTVEEPELEPAALKSNVTPPAPAKAPEPPKPTVGEVTAGPTDEERETAEFEALVNRVLPRRDYRTEAARALGYQPPETPGEFQLGGWDLAAVLAPGLLGALSGQGTAGFSGSASALRGLMAGHAARREQAREGLSAYRTELGQLAGKMEESDVRRAGLTLPYLAEKRGEARRNALAEARFRQQQRTDLFSQQMVSARLAFDEFRWANPSATDQMNARVREIDQNIRQAQFKAQNALAQGRLDEWKRHNVEVERLTGEARDIQREQVAIARQRVQAAIARGGALSSGEANRVRGYYQFILGEQRRVRAAIGNVMFSDPTQQAELQRDLEFYEAESDRLRPQIERIFGFEETPVPGTAGTSGVPTLNRGGANVAAQTWSDGAISEMRKRGAKTRADFIRMRDEMRKNPKASGVPKSHWDRLDTAISGLSD